MSRRDRGTANIPSISSAPTSLAEDQARRTQRYLIQMGIRLVCFVAAILVGGGWLTWVLIGAAIVLPYTAVLFANAGKDQAHYDSSPMEYLALAAGDRGRIGGPGAPGAPGAPDGETRTMRDPGSPDDHGVPRAAGDGGTDGDAKGTQR